MNASSLYLNAKNKALKGIAIFMCFCYLMAPLHVQIGQMMHSVLHFFEMPQTILSHNTEDIVYAQSHERHLEQFTDTTHEHPILGLLEGLFEAYDEHSETEDGIPSKMEVDKHVTSSKYKDIYAHILTSKDVFSFPFKNLPPGFAILPFKPPR